MSNQGIRRWAGRYVPVAFVFGACFVIPGSGVAFSIVQGIALSHATSSSERAVEWMKRRLSGETEEINHDLQKAMRRGYVRAIDHLAGAWKESHGRDRGGRQAHNLAASLFQILKEDAAEILSEERIQEFAGNAEAIQSIGSGNGAASFLEPYLYGHDEQLRDFLQRGLEPTVALFFGEELKTDTRAWRAFQRLVTDSMIAGFSRVEANQQALLDTDQVILAQLDDLAARLAELPEGFRDLTGQDGLETAIESARDHVVAIIREDGERTRLAIAESERNLSQQVSAHLEVTQARFDEIQRSINAAVPRIEVVLSGVPGTTPGAETPTTADGAARTLLGLLSFFAPEEIPLDLIIARASWLPDDLQRALLDPELPVLDVLARQSGEAMVISAHGGLTISEHVQADVRQRLEPAVARKYSELAVRLVSSWLPDNVDDPAVWPVYHRVETHALEVAERAQSMNAAMSQAVGIDRRIAGFSMSQGAYDQARRLYERILAVERANVESDGAKIATVMNDLARALFAGSDVTRARDLLEQSLALRRESLPETDPAIAEALNDLGEIDALMADTEPANERFEAALNLRRNGLPTSHLATAQTLGNLALIRLKQEKRDEAKTLAEESLEMTRRVLVPGDPRLAVAMITLAHALEPFPETSRRKDLLVEALDLRRRVLPPDHPDVATSLYELANFQRSVWQNESARELHEEALAIRERSLPAGHLARAQSLSALAELLAGKDDPKRAMTLYADALDIYRKVLPVGHPVTSQVQTSAMVLSGVTAAKGVAKWAWKKLKRPRNSETEG